MLHLIRSHLLASSTTPKLSRILFKFNDPRLSLHGDQYEITTINVIKQANERQEAVLTSAVRGVGRKLVGSARLLRLHDAVTVFTWGVICGGPTRGEGGRKRDKGHFLS